MCKELCLQIPHNRLQACYKDYYSSNHLLDCLRYFVCQAQEQSGNFPIRTTLLRGRPTYEQETNVLQDKGHDERRQKVREPPESHFDMVLKVGLQYWIRPLVWPSKAV